MVMKQVSIFHMFSANDHTTTSKSQYLLSSSVNLETHSLKRLHDKKILISVRHLTITNGIPYYLKNNK